MSEGLTHYYAKRCYFEAKPPYGTQPNRHLNFLLSSRSSAYVESNHGYIVAASLALCLFCAQADIFRLVLALFAPPLCSSSFTALCAYSYAPSDAIITVSPFSSCPSHEENVASRSIPAAEPPFLFRAACRFDGESRTVPLPPYKRPPCRYTGLFLLYRALRETRRET